MQILAGLVRSENFLLRLRGSNVFVLLGDLLGRHHDSEAVYLATFQLMLGHYLGADPNISDSVFDLQLLRNAYPEASIVVPEMLPLLLQMLRCGMKLEMSLTDRLRAMPQDECSTMTSLSPRCTTIEEEAAMSTWTAKNESKDEESSETLVGSLLDALLDVVCSDRDCSSETDGSLNYDANRSRFAAAAFRAEEITTLNLTTASFLLYLYDRNTGIREKFLKNEIIEAVVGLLFLADDHVDLEVEALGEDGPLSKVKDEVLRRVSGLFRSSGDKRATNQMDADAAGCNPSSTDGDEWDYFRETEGHRASSEVLSSCSLHDKSCTMSTATGEIVFQLLSRMTEESIRTQPKGINAVFVALESIPLSTIASAERGFAGRLLSSLSKYLYVESVEMDILGDSGLVRNLEQFCELIVDIICVDSYPVAHSSPLDFIILVIDKILQAEDRAQDFPVLVARHLVTLHRTANRLVLHLLLRLQYHPERLQAVVASLADKVNVVFSPYNNEAPTIMLIGHALFTLFFHEVRDVRRGSMCIWSYLLETKQAVMLALLSYTDSAGISRSLFHDGFEKLLPAGPEAPKAAGVTTQLELSVDRFSEWLAGGLQNGLLLDQNKWLEDYRIACRQAASQAESASRVTKGGDGASRAAKIARILADNGKKQKVQVVAGAQKRLAAFLSQHQKNRTARLRRRAARVKELIDLQTAARVAASAAQEATLQQWSRLLRRRLQNLESRGVYTAETWSRRKVELCRERGVFGSGDFGPTSADSRVKSQREVCAHTCDPEIRRPLWWRLDSTEGPMRMRRRLELDVQEMSRPRYAYDPASGLHTPIRSAFRAPAPQSSASTAGRWQPSHDMLEPPATCARLRSELEGMATRRTTGLVSQLMSQDLTQRIRGLYSADQGPAADGEGGIIDEDKLLWLLEPGDRLQAVFNCARLSSGDTVAGVCVVCSRHVYVFDHCLVMPSGDVDMFYENHSSSAPPALVSAQRIANHSDLGSISSDDVAEPQAVRRYALASIRDIQRRNYLLRPVGLEMFTSDGLNCLLIFHKSEREAAFERIWACRNSCMQQPPPDDDRPTKGSVATGNSSAALGVAGEASLDMTDSSQTAELATGFWTGQRTAQTLLKKICKLWQVIPI
jgi:hypothetical protein